MNNEQVMTIEQMEMAIANKLVSDALALNYTVSVYDSEVWTVKRSSNQEEIIAALNSSDWDQLKFRKANGDYVGVAALIWGETGYDLINDYTVSDEMTALMEGVEALADQFQELV